jgi:ankyrin repeat protein
MALLLFCEHPQDGKLAIARLLILNGVAGADVNSQNNSGNTALKRASFQGHIETCLLLLDNGALVDAYNGTTALHIAVKKGHINICHLLLDYGALVNKTKYEGTTALHIAVEKRHVDICDLLISRGADWNVANLEDTTVLGLAISHPQILELLTTALSRREFS